MTVQTQPNVTHDLHQAARQGLLPARVGSWLAGFGNMFGKEMGEWFRTRRWLSQLLIWLTIINGFLAFLLFGLPALATIMPNIQQAQENIFSGLPPEIGAVMMFFSIAVMTGTMGAIVLAQDEVIQEKQSGTVAWILSKPAARSAFILTKLLSNTFGILVFIVVIPGLVTVGEVFIATRQVVPLVPFMAGTGVVMLVLFFYLSLVILLGVLFDSRRPVLGGVLGVLFGCSIMKSLIPQIGYILPTSMEGVALSVFLGMPLPAMLVWQVISTAVLSILFVLVALWRFRHIEM
jgi:ABC-2 type transport system permease protein